MSSANGQSMHHTCSSELNANNSILAGSSFRLTPEEKNLYGQLFRQADPDFTQVITGDVASQLFMRSGLSPELLGEIWQMADPENNGFLDQQGFSVALRIIGHAQNGQRLARNLGDIRKYFLKHVVPQDFNTL